MPCFYLHMVCKIGSPCCCTSNVTLNVYFHTTSISSISLGKFVQIVFIYIIAPSVSSNKLFLLQCDRSRIYRILYIITAYIFLTILHTNFTDGFMILSDITAHG